MILATQVLAGASPVLLFAHPAAEAVAAPPLNVAVRNITAAPSVARLGGASAAISATVGFQHDASMGVTTLRVLPGDALFAAAAGTQTFSILVTNA